jgi:thioredoxin-dependent peroxiredoxin
VAIAVGQQVPDRGGVTHDGRSVSLSELASDGPLVIFFYPKAFTPGCTAQACRFRDRAEEFAAWGASVVGVSRDRAETQRRFVDDHHLQYPLIADTDGALARTFGAKRPGPLPSRRMTVVIDADLTLLGSFRSETNMSAHVDAALRLLRERAA